MKVIACHLLNDYSGSPKVLMQLAKGWSKEGIDVTIMTCSGRKGFLSNLPGVTYIDYWYRWSPKPIIRLIYFIISQFVLSFKLFFIASKKDIIYINTILPFGAAIAGTLKGCKIIYHVHETSISPKPLKEFLFAIVKWCAEDVIYVSNYLSCEERIETARTHVLHNALEDDFFKMMVHKHESKESYKNVLMISSLKKYKGVLNLLKLQH